MSRLTTLRPFLALAPVALLAACGGQNAGETDAQASSGQVLEGTISDAMLPLDTVSSQPPLANPEAAARAAASAGAEASAARDAEASETPSEDEGEGEGAAPAEEAAPEAAED